MDRHGPGNVDPLPGMSKLGRIWVCCQVNFRSGLERPQNSERAVMKKGIHPKYQETAVSCGCGSSFTTRSLRPELRVDICSQCHPFYTGKLKYVDAAGRIEKFQSKFKAGSYASLQKPTKKKKG